MSVPLPRPPGRRRSRTRVLWLLATAPLVLALLAVGTHLTLLPLVAHRATTDYANGDFASAAERFASQQRVNRIEPWKAYFNAGTAQLRDGGPTSLTDALENLSRAYALSAREPAEVRCIVQTNLALAHETSGDLAMAVADERMADVPALRDALQAREGGREYDEVLVGEYEALFGSGVTASTVEDDARAHYQKAADDYALAEEVRAQEGCPQASPEKKKQNDDGTQRLQDKRQDAEDSQPEESGEEPAEPEPEPDDGTQEPQTPEQKEEAERQERLREQNDKAEQQEDQQQQEFEDTYGNRNGSGSTTKKW